MRGCYAHMHHAGARLAVAREVGVHAYHARYALRGVAESRREPYPIGFGAACNREVGHVQRPNIQILGTEIHGQRVAAVVGIESEIRGQHHVALDVVGFRLHRERIAPRVEQQLHARSLGYLPAAVDGRHYRIDVLYVDIHDREVVGHDLLPRAALVAHRPFVVEQRYVAVQRVGQILRYAAVGGLAHERRVYERRR